MRHLFLALLTSVSASAFSVVDHLGLQMYSLRVTLHERGWAAELDKARAMGFTFIEGGGLPRGMAPSLYSSEVSARGLRFVSEGFGYDRLTKDPAGAVAEAVAVGAKYAMVAWIPHRDGEPFSNDDARKAAADFNAWGALFKAAGIRFMYHPHGYEFRPDGDGGTPFAVLARETKPEFVNFEIDVFWIAYCGQDPVKLMAAYPDRWLVMHIKDVRRGAATGSFTGKAPASDDVPVGTGQVDWPAVLREGKAVGIQWYFLEDESDTPLVNIPMSVRYLKSLGL
jgi:sugar phosphate isomerase/epimerase